MPPSSDERQPVRQPNRSRRAEPVHARPRSRAAAPAALRWQSKLVLLLVTPAAGVWASVLMLRLYPSSGLTAFAGPAIGALLAAVVWRAHAATPGGASEGGLLMACFCLTTPGWRSCGWPVALMLLLTLAATRLGRARKQRLLSALSPHELKHGRAASQVAANLGVAALAGALTDARGQVVALTALLAALAEATADTLASEIGQAFGGTPRFILTLRPVPPGTDGGLTLAGTAMGAAGAALITAAGTATLHLPGGTLWIAAGAGIAGLLFDSLLGATCERAGWLNNDAVNFLSTLFSALVALLAASR